jgi:hypothetical protein
MFFRNFHSPDILNNSDRRAKIDLDYTHARRKERKQVYGKTRSQAEKTWERAAQTDQ